ncbi:hypothetical protein V495_08530 [Pseudogymnoascus sp. VKM F-4514 (FW-929)]|nr:hypothetical protein V495_08530 [Pseudogymnoascus sp. VKM F-4514 (FW-929)]
MMTAEEIIRLITTFLQDHVYRFNIADVPPIVFGWMREHPGKTVFHIVNGVMVFTPGALTVPLLASMGWATSGPVGSSVASWIQSKIGIVGARTAFAYLQSARMGGYGVSAVNGFVQAFGVAAEGAASVYSYFNSTGNAPAMVLEWIAAHPGQSALLVVNGVLVFTPAAVTGPLLSQMGFGAAGPVGGSVAAWLQSMLGNVGAPSIFAYLQSAAMGGYGVAAVNGVAQACAVISGGVVSMYSGFTGQIIYTRNMLGWWLGKGAEETRREDGQEPPETPAPVFAARAFKSALFGTPAAPSDDTNFEQIANSKNMPAPKQNAKMDISSPSKGILMTPGTARSRKSVSFGAAVKDQEAKADSNSGMPDDFPGKFPSPFVGGAGKQDGRSLRRTALTKTLENVRDTKRRRTEESKTRNSVLDTPQSLLELDIKTGLTAPQIMESSLRDEEPQSRPYSRDMDDFDGDVTIDLNEPHSQSGRYWKSEYEKYNEDARAQMTKLVKYKQMAKSYAKKKDEEAIDLGSKLKEAQKRAVEMEEQIAGLVAQIADGCLNGTDDDSPAMMKNLARQTALAVQYRSQVDEFRDVLKDREQKQEGGNGEKFNEDLDVLLKKPAGDLRSEVQRLRRDLSTSQREASKLRDENANLSRDLEKANEKLSQSEKRRQASESMSHDRAQLLQGLQTKYENLKESAKAQRGDAEHLLKKRHDQVSELKKEMAALKERLAASRVERSPLVSEKESEDKRATYSNVDLKLTRTQFKPTSQDRINKGQAEMPPMGDARNKTEEASKPCEIYEDLRDREKPTVADSTLQRRRSAMARVQTSGDGPRHLRSKSDALGEIGNNKSASNLPETTQPASDFSLRERFAKLAVDSTKRDLPLPGPFSGNGLRRTPSQKQAASDLIPTTDIITQETSKPTAVRPRSFAEGEGTRSSNWQPSRLSSMASTRSRTTLDPERAAAAKARLDLRNAEKRRARERKENMVM